jgi:hypothetical protein
MRSPSSFWTPSGCATRSAGQCSSVLTMLPPSCPSEQRRRRIASRTRESRSSRARPKCRSSPSLAPGAMSDSRHPVTRRSPTRRVSSKPGLLWRVWPNYECLGSRPSGWFSQRWSVDGGGSSCSGTVAGAQSDGLRLPTQRRTVPEYAGISTWGIAPKCRTGAPITTPGAVAAPARERHLRVIREIGGSITPGGHGIVSELAGSGRRSGRRGKASRCGRLRSRSCAIHGVQE